MDEESGFDTVSKMFKKSEVSLKALSLIAVAAAFLAFVVIPSGRVVRPAEAINVAPGGNVKMLTLYETRESALSRWMCKLNKDCFEEPENQNENNTGKFPATLLESQEAAAAAVKELTGRSGGGWESATDLSNVKGPSGGLSLAIAQWLDQTSSTLGGKIGATGSVRADGAIGAVGGLDAKLALARKENLDMVILPAGEKYDATLFQGEIKEVSTLAEALLAACSWPGSSCAEIKSSLPVGNSDGQSDK